MDPFRLFIGWDPRDALAWKVCAASVQAAAREPVSIAPIYRQQLERTGVYRRPHTTVHAGHWDDLSWLPCSTEFSIARFGLPLVAGRAGWALFCDADFLWRDDVWSLFEFADPRYACMVVKHRHVPADTAKMDGQVQRPYARKNWSSLTLWNLAHAGAQRLDVGILNGWHRDRLHAFEWLKDEEIGELPEPWNWLDGHSRDMDPCAVHFTRGTPDMPGWEHTRYAAEWNHYAQAFVAREATCASANCVTA